MHGEVSAFNNAGLPLCQATLWSLWNGMPAFPLSKRAWHTAAVAGLFAWHCLYSCARFFFPFLSFPVIAYFLLVDQVK